MKPTAASSKRGVAGQLLRNMGVRAEECTLRCLQLKRRSTSGAGARHLEATSTPKVEESGACLARRPRRTKMVTERYASMGCRRLAHDRTLEYVYIYIYICMYIHKYFASRNCRAADLDQPTKPTAASSNRGVAGQVLRNMCVPSRMPQKCSAKPRGQTILTAP